LYATVIASVPLIFFVFLRQHLADKERLRLLAQSELSIENLPKAADATRAIGKN